MATTNLVVSDLDFKRIKKNIRDFMKSQETFKSYNFEGSFLTILIDVLAYNTHYNGVYNHVAITESFMDSAAKRSSVLSRAKELGYTPRTITASTALITVMINNVNTNESSTFKNIERGVRFRGSYGSVFYDFITVGSTRAYLRNDAYVFDNVEIKEGTLKSYSFKVTEDNAQLPFVLPHQFIDSTTIGVSVQESETSSGVEVFDFYDSMYGVTRQSKSFWVQIGIFGQPEIYFGDGVIGKKLSPGNVVLVDYLVTPETPTNGVTKFQATADPIAGFSSSRAIVLTVNDSFGGAQPESIESVRSNAPLYHAARGRAVTVNDYYGHLQNKFPFIETISIWGGEDNVPPEFGRVFISIKPKIGYYISEQTKQFIIQDLVATKSVVTIQPKFVDPLYIYMSLQIKLLIDNKKTTMPSHASFNALITQYATQYFSTRMNQFNSSFIGAELIHYIRSIDKAITGVDVTSTLQFKFKFKPGVRQSVTNTFGNKIRYATLVSQPFMAQIGSVATEVIVKDIPVGFGDDVAYKQKGTLYLFSFASGSNLIKIGSVDYNSGNVEIDEININSVSAGGDELRITAELRGYDAFARFNTIITHDPEAVGSIPGINTGIFVTSSGY